MFHRRCERDGRSRAQRWYWRQSGSFFIHFLAERGKRESFGHHADDRRCPPRGAAGGCSSRHPRSRSTRRDLLLPAEPPCSRVWTPRGGLHRRNHTHNGGGKRWQASPLSLASASWRSDSGSCTTMRRRRPCFMPGRRRAGFFGRRGPRGGSSKPAVSRGGAGGPVRRDARGGRARNRRSPAGFERSAPRWIRAFSSARCRARKTP